MFERPKSGEKAALIQVAIGESVDSAKTAEFHLLAKAAGAEIVYQREISRGQVEPKYFIGKGQAEEIAAALKMVEAEVVIFNAPLSPSQERNLEKLFNIRVLDRSGLVLDIFAQRARSHEGKLQVELAQLSHLATRLVRGWTHLERQKGGIGLRGPGETQLETDRRLLAVRLKQLKKRLEKVSKQRFEVRKSRERRAIPVVALAGYTNSGKSSLFNALTDAEVLAKNQLFATLDPTWRKLNAVGQTILLADTVGFISDLPHELVEAFKSTLEETAYADLILHVIDAADEERLAREEVVVQVLDEIGAQEVAQIRVYNKIDLTGDSAAIKRDAQGRVEAVYCSALTTEGLEQLRQAIVEFFQEEQCEGWLVLAPDEGALRAELFAQKAVLAQEIAEDGAIALHIRLSSRQLATLQARYRREFELVEKASAVLL